MPSSMTGSDSPVLALEDQRAAERLLQEAATQGRIGEQELTQRIERVYKATTPHQLWQATNGLAGDRHRSDWGIWLKGGLVLIAVIAFAIVSMFVLGWGLAQDHGQSPPSRPEFGHHP